MQAFARVQQTKLHYFSIIILAFVCSIGCLSGDFVFDDTEAIVNNNDVSSGALSNIFYNDFWGTNLTHKLSHKSYRPLTVLSYRFNHWLFGGLVSWSFHIFNSILHVIVCLVLWKVYYILIGDEKSITCLWASWLFCTHPIHVEAVCGVVGRADLLAALFFLLSFWMYSKAPTIDGSISFCYLFLSVIFAALAMFSKEHGITVLGFNIAYEILAVQKLDLKKIMKLKFNELVRFKYRRSLFCLLSAAVLVYLRCLIMDFKMPSFHKVDNPSSFVEDIWFRTISLQFVASLNLWLLLCPDWLCFDWSMGCVPVIDKFTDIRILVPVICIIGLVYLIFTTCMRHGQKRQRELILCLSLMLIPFLPSSNLLFRVGFVVAERILYIPSAGFCLLVALGIEKLLKRKDVTVMFAFLLMIFIIKSHSRSLDWRSETRLFTSALRVCPDNAKVRYNIAKSAADKGYAEYAISEYREAIRLFPEYEQALNNLANLLKGRGELAEAERLLRRAVKIRPDFPAAWMNLGIILSTLKKYPEAEKHYVTAIKLRKIYPDCYYNMGNMYLDQNRMLEAEMSWRKAIKFKPSMKMAWNNLIMLKDNNGNHSEAIQLGEQALESAGEEPSFHFNIANAYGKMSSFSKAEDHFKKAVELDPNNALYHVNFGVLYHRWQKYSLAETYYLNALQLNPKLHSANQNYLLLKKKLLSGKMNPQGTT